VCLYQFLPCWSAYAYLDDDKKTSWPSVTTKKVSYCWFRIMCWTYCVIHFEVVPLLVISSVSKSLIWLVLKYAAQEWNPCTQLKISLHAGLQAANEIFLENLGLKSIAECVQNGQIWNHWIIFLFIFSPMTFSIKDIM